MQKVELRDLLDNIISRSDHLHGSKRAVIWRAQHDEAGHFRPRCRHSHASHQAAHTMCNKAHLGCWFLLDLIREVHSEVLEAPPPVVRKEIGVEASDLQPQLQFQISKQDRSRGVIRRCGGIQLERHQLADRDFDRIDPQDVFDAERALFGKRGAHDAGKDENARPATNRPRGGIPSQVAKLTVVVGTEVVFQQAPAFAG